MESSQNPTKESKAIIKPSEYRVLARKYRPRTFDDLIGQDFLVRIISNAFKLERIAHAFLFTGVRGVGKTTAARIIAKGLNCLKNEKPTISPCGECESCKAATSDRHMDIIEIDAASHTGVDDMRELTDGVRYKPAVGRYRIYIIDEVHMLSTAAFNALLKTLEEPPEHSKFIFCTTEVRKIPITVLSRCQRFDLRRVSEEQLRKHLQKLVQKEKVNVDDTALKIIASSCDGSVRDSLSLLDQAISVNEEGAITEKEVKEMLGLSDRQTIWDLFDFILSGSPNEVIKCFDDLVFTGCDPLLIIEDLMNICHLVTRVLATPSSVNTSSLSEYDFSRAKDSATKLNMSSAAKCWQLLLKGHNEIQNSYSVKESTEMVLLRITYAADLPDLKNLINKDSENVKKKLTEDYIGTKDKEDEELNSENNLTIGSFEELLVFVKSKKEMALYTDLSDKLRLIDYKLGYIKCSIEGEYSDIFITNIRNKLNVLTGKEWDINISEEESMMPYSQLKDLKLEKKKENVKKNPLVESLMREFPKSELSEIKDN